MVPRQEGNRIETEAGASSNLVSENVLWTTRAAAQTNYPCRM